MKKLLLVAAIAVFGMGISNAQEGSFAAGVNVGLPIGDFGDFYTFGVGIEAMYLYPATDDLTLGGSLGFSNYFGDTSEVTIPGIGTVEAEAEDAQFVPVAVKAIYSFGDSGFGIGADVGYAIGINDGNDGGIMYEPQLVFNTESVLFSLGYQGISNDGDSINSIQLGAAYKF